MERDINITNLSARMDQLNTAIGTKNAMQLSHLSMESCRMDADYHVIVSYFKDLVLNIVILTSRDY